MHRVIHILRHSGLCFSSHLRKNPRLRCGNLITTEQTLYLNILPRHNQLRVFTTEASSDSPNSSEPKTADPDDVFGSLHRKGRRKIERKRRASLRKSDGEMLLSSNEKVAEEIFDPDNMDICDLYGTISDPDYQTLRQYEDNDDENLPEIIPFRQRPWWYLLHMRKLIRRQRLPQALEFFEVKMRVEDQVRPLRTVYDMLIAACGRAGYLQKAFDLFTEMRRRQYVPVDATYVGLFNACAECPPAYRARAIGRARSLREILFQKGHTPNQIVYHSMIKAFGRCGDLVTAFQLADEMVANQIGINDDTFNFLLMACISDKESGLTYALKTWRFMRKSGRKPALSHYGLLLKAVHECRAGSADVIHKELVLPDYAPLLQAERDRRHDVHQRRGDSLPDLSEDLPSDTRDPDKTVSVTTQVNAYMQNPKTQWALTFERETRNRSKKLDTTRNALVVSGQQQNSSRKPVFQEVVEEWKTYARSRLGRRKTWIDVIQPINREAMEPTANELWPLIATDYSRLAVALPNVPDPASYVRRVSDMMASTDANFPFARLQFLFGGYQYFFEQMHKDDVVPDLKILTQVIDDILPTPKAVEDILKLLRKLSIRPDIDFYNTLIKKRVAYRDFDGAWELFRQIEADGMLVNEMTFGCLAWGCTSKARAVEMLAEMEKRDLQPNIIIFAKLMTKAMKRVDMYFLLAMMSQMRKLKVAPDERLLSSLESFRTEIRKGIISTEKGINVNEMFTTEVFKSGWKLFAIQYESWLKSIPIPKKKSPWTAYGWGQKWPSLINLEKQDEESRLRAQ